MSNVRIYGAKDADPAALAGKRVAVVGYGIQGHAHALNLRDSGVDVVVGLRPGGPSAEQARAAGFEVLPIAEAVRGADLVSVLIPDMAQPSVYRDQIAPNLAPGSTLLFAHGFNVHYGEIEAPAEVDVVLVAPKAPGHMLRREYQAGFGVPSLVAVHQDATGQALARALAYAHALGSTRTGVLETSFAEETETDLFGEQAVLCGGVAELVEAGFETLVEAGYAPEMAYFECLHELKLIVDLIYTGGLGEMRRKVSDTAEYGGLVSGPRVVDSSSRAAMRQVLAEIRSGEFARRWIEESNSGGAEFERLRAEGDEHQIERVGERLRSQMAWQQEGA